VAVDDPLSPSFAADAPLALGSTRGPGLGEYEDALAERHAADLLMPAFDSGLIDNAYQRA
jgi:hypothetical protein